MSRIREECIRQARETPIRDVWSRLGLPDVRTSAAFRSPFREDKKPSCQLGGAKNIFFDHATSESLDPIALVRKARDCSFKEAVAFVLGRPLEDLLEMQARPNSQRTSGGGSPRKQAASDPGGGSPPDAIEELARVRGWRPEAIRALGAESRNAQAPREVHFPMRDGAGAVVGFRRRRSDGKPFSNGSKAMSSKGAKNGLLCPWPLPEEGPVLVVEGEADACAALSAGFAAVVATPGASVPKMVVSALQKIVTKREVVLFPDPDEPGRGWLERVGRALANSRCAVRFAPADDEDLDKRLKHESNPREALEALIRDAALFIIRDDGSGRRPQSNLTPLILPNEAHGERLSDTARMLFPVVAPKHVFFQRGGKMVEVAEVDHEMTLNILGPDAFRSRIERHFEVVVYRSGPNDSLLLKPTVCPCDTARALMETLDARHDLPSIGGISGCPLIDVEGRILGKGYDPNDLKIKLKSEGNELYEKIVPLKMTATDGKKRLTDVVNTEELLRIIQSIPLPKAEPFKMWLAQVGRERIEETIDPEITIDRALSIYLKKGYSREWINQRLQAIQVRKELTDEWEDRGVKQGVEYAILTDEISKARSGMTTRQYKRHKGLKKENLRDNMSTLELVLNMLAEATTTEISKTTEPQTFEENKNVAKRGGQIGGTNISTLMDIYTWHCLPVCHKDLQV